MRRETLPRDPAEYPPFPRVRYTDRDLSVTGLLVRVTDFAVLIASDTGVVPCWTGGTFDLEAA